MYLKNVILILRNWYISKDKKMRELALFSTKEYHIFSGTHIENSYINVI